MDLPSARKQDSVLALCVVAFLAAIYLSTLLPGPGFHGDVAKWQFVPALGGIPHPTGYPSYLLLQGTFTNLVPFGELAWRANLFSALCMLGAAAVLFAIQRTLEVPGHIALLVSAGFGLWTTVWTLAIVAEVYALNVLLLAVMTLGVLRWERTGQGRWLLLLAAALAVALGNHLTALAAVPALAAVLWTSSRPVPRDPRLWGAAGALLLLGASSYGLLILRTHDPSTPYVESPVPDLAALFTLLRGGDFGGSLRLGALVGLPPTLGRVVLETFGGALLGLWGWTRLPRGARIWAAVLGGLYVAWLGVFDIPDIHLHALPLYLLAAIGLGPAVAAFDRPRAVVYGLGGWLALCLAVGSGAIRSQVHESPLTHRAMGMASWFDAMGSQAILMSPAYHESEYLWYALLGVGHGERRQLHVVHDADLDAVAAYVRGEGPLHLRQRRMDAPEGWTVYFIRAEDGQGLLGRGLRVEPAGAGLYRVLPQ